MIVLKKINNNAAICKDGSGRELVAFGKGIGFPQTPYTLTDLRRIERTFYNVNDQFLPLLNDIPYDIIRFTAVQLQAVQDELPFETNSSLIFTLADHIAFAIERTRKGIYVRLPTVYLSFSICGPVRLPTRRSSFAPIARLPRQWAENAWSSVRWTSARIGLLYLPCAWHR